MFTLAPILVNEQQQHRAKKRTIQIDVYYFRSLFLFVSLSSIQNIWRSFVYGETFIIQSFINYTSDGRIK